MKNSSMLLVLSIVALSLKTICNAQEPTNLNINLLNTQLANGMLGNEEYLNAIDNWINEQFAAGAHFERDSLTNLLSTWKSIAWGADSLVAYRINYYINLSNNANYANREGESVYFLEKAEQEILSAYGERPLMVAGRKCNTYIDKRNYKNVIATYEKEKAYIEQFPELIRSKKINLNIAISFINVLNPTVQAYAKLRDTLHMREALALAEAIHAELKKRIKPMHNNAFITNFYVQQLYYYNYFTLEGNKQKSHEALQAMQHALYGDTTKPASLIGQLEPVLVTRQVEYFLKYQENDSAAYYLARLKAMPGVFTDHDFTLNHFEAELLANRRLYQQAYTYARQALFDIDSIQSILVNDIDEMLYAHTDAEYNRLALQEAERIENRRKQWLIGIILLSVGIIVTVSLLLLRKSKQAKKLIGRLNDAANIQVAAMEEITAHAVRQEQQRLARDLHDNLSSTLAGIKHQLELLIMDNPSSPLTAKLVEIGDYMGNAYAIARGKSHQWFQHAESIQETSFQTRIQTLLDTALPDSRYTKTVEIDEQALDGVILETRIELLRIVQEAVTNIIKHAKARRVSILLYREDDELVMTIADDGKGISPHHTASGGLGIRSMEERIRPFGGMLTINSKSDGTEVIVQLMLNACEV